MLGWREAFAQCAPPTCVPQCGHLAYILKARCPPLAQAAASAAGRPLLVVGSINMDLVLSVERLPAAGETLSARTLQTFPGGKAGRRRRRFRLHGTELPLPASLRVCLDALPLRTARWVRRAC